MSAQHTSVPATTISVSTVPATGVIRNASSDSPRPDQVVDRAERSHDALSASTQVQESAEESDATMICRRRRRKSITSRAPRFSIVPCWGGVTLVGLVWLCLALPASAERTVDVRFDTASLNACRDITTDDFAAANPQERLVEGRFRVTALLDEEDAAGELQYVYRFSSPAGRLRVVDYRPKTRQTTTLAGNVSVEKKLETSKSLGLSMSGSFQDLVHGTAGSDLGSKNSSSMRYELKPPMEAVLVAGTIDRGTGVYFKLRPSPDRTLEGAHEFTVVMRVPSDWRGDLMYVRCEAQHERRGKLESRGVARFVVGLYAEGDEPARRAAEALVFSEAQLRRTVEQRQRDIDKRAMPSLIHKVGAMLDIYEPPIPESWLDRLIYGGVTLDEHEFYAHLPATVRQAADQYQQAKRRMYQLSGSRLAMLGGSDVRG